MAEIYNFVPRQGLRGAANVSEFIDGCTNQLTIFGPDLDFDALTWDVTQASERRASSKAERIAFCTLETTGLSTVPEPMVVPFINFAKAYIRYQQGLRPTKNPAHRLSALRCVEKALREANLKAPWEVSAETLNRASQIAKENWTAAVIYRIGVNLELLGRFLDEKAMSTTLIGWKNPFERPGDTVRVGTEFEERRASKLPSAAALEAIPKAFLIATEPRDIILASVGAILCSVPARIAELLTLPIDCEAGRLPGSDRDDYGLRWWPAKGAEPQIKWVIPSMADIVRQALANIRKHTEKARIVARWYEQNPSDMYLAPEHEHLRGTDLDFDTLGKILGGLNGKSYRTNNKIPVRNSNIKFSDVEKHVIGLLPADFPIFDRASGIKYSEAMFVVLRNEFRETQALSCMIERVTHGPVNDGFGARVDHGVRSMFSRLEMSEPDGSPIVVTSHKFRHFLNTLAQKGGADQLDIAKWSGRKDVRQNSAYDHESAQELLERVRQTVGDAGGLFGLPDVIRVNTPVSREEYARMVAPTAHVTEAGFCLHDFAATPCQVFRDCLRCTEHVCVKGDRRKADWVRHALAEARQLLAKAKDGQTDGKWGADRWVTAQEETVARLTALQTLLEDPDLPDGSLIRLSGGEMPSRIREAAEAQGIEVMLPPEPPAELALAAELMADMR